VAIAGHLIKIRRLRSVSYQRKPAASRVPGWSCMTPAGLVLDEARAARLCPGCPTVADRNVCEAQGGGVVQGAWC